MVPLPSLLTFALVFPSSADVFPRQLSALLLEAPRWAQELPLGLGKALGGRETIQQLAVQKFPSPEFPNALLGTFHLLESEPVSSSVFWTIFKASLKTTNQQVALKILKKFPEGDWVTQGDNAIYRALIASTHKECVTAEEVHKNWEADAEGAKVLSQCVLDGTSDLPPLTPLYVAMEWGGPTLLDLWGSRVRSPYGGPQSNVKILREATQQMMMGLRCMSNSKADVQWVHHNLNPEALHASMDGLKSVKLTISNFENALSSANPKEETGSNTWYRPPEFAGMKPLVGFSPPVHSYDTFSAALTLLTLLNGGSLPGFYFVAFLTNVIRNAELYMPTRIASCIREKTGTKDDFQTFVDGWERCVTKVEENSHFDDEFDKVLHPLRLAKDKFERKHELTKLVTCFHPGDFMGSKLLVQYVVEEWVETGFDKVLLSMLDTEPSNRPTPEVVLQSAYFSPSRTYGSAPEVECPPGFMQEAVREVQVVALSLIVAVFALLVTGSLAFLCCCCGTCCSVCRSTPSATWTGLVIATYVFGGAVAANLWLSRGAVTLLELLGFMLGATLVVSGCMGAGSSFSPNAKVVHLASLICSFLFCVGLFVGLRLNAAPLLTVIGYVKDHNKELEAALEDNSEIVLKSVGLLEDFIWFSFYPPVFGTMFSCFGLWRAQQHMRDRRASQVVVTPGMEMRTSSA